MKHIIFPIFSLIFSIATANAAPQDVAKKEHDKKDVFPCAPYTTGFFCYDVNDPTSIEKIRTANAALEWNVFGWCDGTRERVEKACTTQWGDKYSGYFSGSMTDTCKKAGGDPELHGICYDQHDSEPRPKKGHK